MSEKIIISDQTFEEYLRDLIGKETGDITKQDFEQIEYLDLSSGEFKNISSIRYCKNLRKINFAENFSEKYDLSVLKDFEKLKAFSLFNPREEELSELGRYVNFTSLDIIFWGETEIFSLNAYKEIKDLNIMNYTGKPFSCKNISELTKLRYLRLCSTVSDKELLQKLPMLEEFKNE